jgi:hypothetical protein
MNATISKETTHVATFHPIGEQTDSIQVRTTSEKRHSVGCTIIFYVYVIGPLCQPTPFYSETSFCFIT